MRWVGEFALLPRTACRQPPVYTLTYVYRDSTAVLGPLAAYVEPHCYDLCATHAERLTVPRGRDVDPAARKRSRPSSVDDRRPWPTCPGGVREQRQRSREPQGPRSPSRVREGVEVGRARHLRMVLGPAPPETAPPGEPAAAAHHLASSGDLSAS